jgi:O-antigen/teichoic acid export membrane protein
MPTIRRAVLLRPLAVSLLFAGHQAPGDVEDTCRTMPIKGGRSSIAADSLSALALRVSLYATGFLGSILISRTLGPEGRGLYYLPVVTAATVASFANLGLEPANVYLLGNSHVSMARLWAQGGLIAVGMGMVGLLVTLAAPALLPSLYAQTPLLLLALSGLTIPLTLHVQITGGLLALVGRVTVQFRAGLLGSIVQVALLGGLAAAGELSVASVLGTTLVSSLATWWVVACRAAEPGLRWVAWDPALLRQTLGHAIPLHLASVLLFLHLRLDMFMVSAWSGAAALGLYSLAVVLAETVQLATDSLSLALLPRQVGNSLEEAARMSLRGVRSNALIGGTLAIGWAVLGPPLIVVAFGRAFLPAYLPLTLLLPGVLALSLQRACGPAVVRGGHAWGLAAIQVASLSVNASLNALLIPSIGPAGAALASTISYSISAAIVLRWTARIAGDSLWCGAVPRVDDAVTIWTAGVRALRVATGRAPGNARAEDV